MESQIVMTPRNLILIICLTLFLVGYVSYWAYNTLYSEPRVRLEGAIEKLSGEIAGRKELRAGRTQFIEQHRWYFPRSLPRNNNDARSLYSFWLWELLQHSGLENNHVNPHSPSRLALGAEHRFSIQCTGSLPQLSLFMFEFYYAPFLHRIASLTLTPIEGTTEQLTFSMTISVLQLAQYQPSDPYPAMNQLPPTDWRIPRLASNDLFGVYQVIAERNLLRTARGGIDRADYAVLTMIVKEDNQREAWFSVRTDDTTVKVKLGDPIHIGSFSGKIVEILDQDIVLERRGERWLLTTGESLNEAFALPPETALQ